MDFISRKRLCYTLCPILLLVVGFLTSWISNSGNNNEWYAKLKKAPWTPPGWVFSVVWTILYILLGVVFARTIVDKSWKTALEKTEFGFLIAVILFILVWPFAYFMGKSQLAGIVLILLIVILTLAYCIMTGVDRKFIEMGCMIPLFVWGIYATSLAWFAFSKHSGKT